MSWTKISNLTPTDYTDPKKYMLDVDKDLIRLSTYLGSGITEDVVIGAVTLKIRNGIIVGHT
jgi:hypothetical protein